MLLWFFALCFGHEQLSFLSSGILNISVDFLASTCFFCVFLVWIYYWSVMSSRHRHKRSLSRESHRASSSPKRKNPPTDKTRQNKLDIILASLTDLNSDVSGCNSRISTYLYFMKHGLRLAKDKGKITKKSRRTTIWYPLAVMAGN